MAATRAVAEWVKERDAVTLAGRYWDAVRSPQGFEACVKAESDELCEWLAPKGVVDVDRLFDYTLDRGAFLVALASSDKLRQLTWSDVVLPTLRHVERSTEPLSPDTLSTELADMKLAGTEARLHNEDGVELEPLPKEVDPERLDEAILELLESRARDFSWVHDKTLSGDRRRELMDALCAFPPRDEDVADSAGVMNTDVVMGLARLMPPLAIIEHVYLMNIQQQFKQRLSEAANVAAASQ